MSHLQEARRRAPASEDRGVLRGPEDEPDRGHAERGKGERDGDFGGRGQGGRGPRGDPPRSDGRDARRGQGGYVIGMGR